MPSPHLPEPTVESGTRPTRSLIPERRSVEAVSIIAKRKPQKPRPVKCPYCGNGVVVLNDHKRNCVIWDVIA